MNDNQKETARCEYLEPKIEVDVWVPAYWESVEEDKIPKSVLGYAKGILRDFSVEHPELTVERIEVQLGVGRWRIFTHDGPEVEGP